MPRYNYICRKCSNEDQNIIFETKHGINEKPEVHCPKCNGIKTEITLLETNITHFIHGNGYLDRAGVRRNMNLHQLQNDDPYAHMRSADDRYELEKKLRNGGKHQGHPKNIFVTK